MNQDLKEKIFSVALDLYHRAEEKTFDGRDYFEQAEGAFKIIAALGLDTEYIRFSAGR